MKGMKPDMDLESLELTAIRVDGAGVIHDAPVTFTPSGRGFDIAIGGAEAYHLHVGAAADLICYLGRFLAGQERANWALLPTEAREERMRSCRTLSAE